MKKNFTTDMTTGSPIKHILKFTLPLLIGNLFQQLYNMVDSIVVGKFVGEDALAAVGSCGSTNFLFFSLGNGLGLGIGVIVSQYFGAGDNRNVRKTIANSYYVLVSTSVIVSIIGVLAAPWLLRLLGTPEDIFHDTLIYMQTTTLGLIAISMYNGVSAILRALGDSKTPLVFLIVACLINVVLDLLFVIVFGWAVFGVALATVIAQAISAITCYMYAYKKIEYFRVGKEEAKMDWSIIGRSFRIGIPLALQNGTIAVSCMVLQGVVNSFGENVMAAYTITIRIESIVQQPYSSLAAAMTTFAGQNAGAGRADRIKKGFRQCVVIVLIFSLALIPLFYAFGESIASIFVDNTEVIDISARALRVTSLFYFGLGMIYVPRALLNGCGDAAFAILNGLVEVAGRVVFSQIFLLIPALGWLAVWLTTGATWAVTGLVCLIRYWTGNWKKRIEMQTIAPKTV